MEQLTKKCFKGELITDPFDIYRLAIDKKSVYTTKFGVKPAAFILSMQFLLVIRLIKENKMYYVVKKTN